MSAFTYEQVFEEVKSNTYFALAYTNALRTSMQHWWLDLNLMLAVPKVKRLTRKFKALSDQLSAEAVQSEEGKTLLAHLKELHSILNLVLEVAERTGIRKKILYSRCFTELESCNRVIGDLLEKHHPQFAIEKELAEYIRNNAGSLVDFDPAFESAAIDSWIRSDQ